MKILYYNWADYLSDEGGGVTVYINNLMNSAMAHGNEAVFLFSGMSYDKMRSGAFWREYTDGAMAKSPRYEIVNSSVLAPAYFEVARRNPAKDRDTSEVFVDFLRNHGPFDIVHFHNLEGLPPEAVEHARKALPEATFVFSAHNYYPLCPQVNLWDYRVNESCNDFVDGKRCYGCNLHPNAARQIRRRYLAHLRKRSRVVDCFYRYKVLSFLGQWIITLAVLLMKAWKATTRLFKKRPPAPTPVQPLPEEESSRCFLYSREALWHPAEVAGYADRRRRFVELLNNAFDNILCVSERVRDIYRNYGVDASRMDVLYIGTKHAYVYDETPFPSGKIVSPDNPLHLAFMGYPRADKGFFFWLDALEGMPRRLAEDTQLTFCVHLRNNPELHMRLLRLKQKFRAVYHHDGYQHNQLRYMLKDVTLGVIPSLWEDNLPQVSIELHCRKIPLLCSDLGGAKELMGGQADFVFRHGDKNDLYRKLKRIVEDGLTHEDYWRNARKPLTLREHADELSAHYSRLIQARGNARTR